MRNLANASALFFVVSILIAAQPAQAFWTTNGLLVRSSTSLDQNAEIIPDGAGGVIITWENNYNIYAQRLDADGNPVWGTSGVAVCTSLNSQYAPKIISDGTGGAIITWSDARVGTNDIYAQLISASGTALWTTNGVSICSAAGAQWRPDITSDGAGGAIIAWDDYRIDMYNRNIYAQRISTSGVVQWAANGVIICSAANNQGNPKLVSDGASGAIVMWEDARTTNTNHIYAQRVSSSGVCSWSTNGVALFASSQYYASPQIISDGAAGAYVTCSGSTSFGDEVFAQRISSSGVAFWATNGVAVSDQTGSDSQVLVSDGSNGAIIAFMQGDLDVRAQRLDASGNRLWGANGAMVCDGTTTYRRLPRIASDGSSGAIVVWEDERNGSTNDDIYAQRVSSNGTCVWPINGIAACTASSTQMLPCIAAASPGRAIIAWQDYRSGTNYDIYAQEAAPPALTAATAKSPHYITVAFDEALEIASVENEDNYLVLAWDGLPTPAIWEASIGMDPKSVFLVVEDSLLIGRTYAVRAQNIKAIDGVIMPAADTIDVTFGFPPTVEFTGGPSEGQGISVDTALFAWTGHSDISADNELTYQFALDDDAPSAWSSDTSVVLSDIGDGLHTFTVWVKDGYGNIGSVTRGFSVYLYGHGVLALFADPEGTDCDLDIGLYQTKDLYLFYIRGNGPILGNALEFRIKRSTAGAVLMSPEWSSDIALTMGDVNSGISLTGTRCLGITQIGDTLEKVYIGKIPVFNISETDTFNIRVVDDPNASPPGTYVTTCDRYNTLVDVFGGAATFNGPCTSDFVDAVAPTRAKVDVAFGQLIDSLSAVAPANYRIFETENPTEIAPIQSVALLPSQSAVTLTLADSLQKAVLYSLKLYGVLGISGDAIASGQDFPVETQFPSVVITAGPSEGQFYPSRNVLFSWHGTSALTPHDSLLYSYRVDDGTQSAWSHDTTVTLAGVPEGGHYFIVWVKDRDGVTEWADRRFLVDVTPPAYSAIAYPGQHTNGFAASTTVSITGSAADVFTPSDTIYTSASLDAGFWTPWQKQPAGDPAHTYSFDSLSYSGAHVINVRARDLAGNVSIYTTDQFYVDAVAPETWFADYQSKSLHDVWTVSSTLAFAVGDGGMVLRYDGSSWSRMTTGTTAALEAVWAIAGDNAYAVGQNGIIIHYNGASWDSIPSGTAERLYDIWGSSASNAYAVGAGGTILRFDGGTWSPISSGTSLALYGIWGTSADDIFAVGADGAVLHFDGLTWTTMASGTGRPLFAVWGTGSSSVYAAGKDQLVLRYNGVAWSVASGPGAMNSGLDYTSVWGSAANDVYVVEHASHLYDPGVSPQRSRLLHFNGSSWNPVALNTDALVEAVHGSSASDIHVVGMTNTVLHYSALSDKRILLYTTENSGTANATRRWDYDEDLPAALALDGFSVACHDRESMPALTHAILGGYDQLWLVSTESDATFSADELQAIWDFHNAGKGVLIIGDSAPYDGPANAVSTPWNATIAGTLVSCGSVPGCPISTAGFTSHALWNGVTNIQGNQHQGIIWNSSPPVQVIAVSAASMVAVYNVAGVGRVVWDVTWYRFSDATCNSDVSIAYYDNARYARNIAAWLNGSGNSWSLVKNWRVEGELYGSAAGPVTLTAAGSDDQTPIDSLVYDFKQSNDDWSLQTDGNEATVTLPSVPDGAYTVTVQTVDYAGTRDAVPPAFSFMVDRTAPVPVIISGPAAGQPILTDSIRFCWSATDNLAPLDQLLFSFALDGEAPSEWASWQPDHCASYSGLTYGAHTFTVWAKDLLGNTASIVRTFNVDAMHDPLANGSDPYFLWRQSSKVQWKTDEGGYLTGPLPGSESWYEAVVGRRKFATAGNPYAICRIKHTAGASNVMFGFGDTDPNTTNFYYDNIDFGVYVHSANPLLVRGVTGTPPVPPPTLASGIYDIMIWMKPAAAQVGVSVEKVSTYDAPPSDFVAPLWSATYSKTIGAPINYLQINPYATAMRVYDVWANRDTSDVTPPETEFVSGPAEGSIIDTSLALFTWTGSDNKTTTAELVYAWKLDASEYSAFTAATSRSLTGLTDGSHTFSVKARDGFWNEDLTPATRSFIADITPPSITITAGPAAGQHLTAPETAFAWTASDLVSPPESILFSYRLDAAAFSAWDTIRSVNLTTLSEGPHVFNIRAIDEVGHAGSIQRTFSVDLTPPESEIVFGPQDGGWSPATMTVTWTGTDNVSHTDSLSFSTRLDAESWSAWSKDKSTALGALADGDHVFRVRAMDLAGHVDETPDSTSFVVVGAATAVTGPVTTNTTWTKEGSPYIVTGDVIVRGAAAGALATLTIEPGVEVRFYPGTGLYVGDPITGTPYYFGAVNAQGTEIEPIVFTSNAIVPSPGDWKGIYFTNEITDAATTLSRCAVLYGGHTNGSNIYCYGATPAILEYLEISHGSAWGLIASSTALSIHNSSFSDNQSGGVQNLTPGTPVDAVYNWWGASSGPSGAGPGAGQAISGGVLYEPWLLREPVSDTAAPSVSLTTAPAEGAYVSSPLVPFEWAGGDDVTPPDSLVYSYSLDGDPFSAWSAVTAIDLTLAEGTHTFRVRARDLVGRISETAIRSFAYDVTPPNTQITEGPPSDGWISATNAFFSWSGTDNVAPADSLVFSYMLDQGSWSAYAGATSVSFTNLAEGSHTFAVRASDLAGLEDPTPDSLSFSVDTLPPETEITSGPPEGSFIDTSGVTVVWRGSDDRAPAGQLVFASRIDGGAYSAFSADTVRSFAGLGDGSHTVSVKARDLALNEDATPAQRSFVIDRSAPAIVFTAGPPEGHFQSEPSIAFCWAGTDAYTPPWAIQYAYRLDGGERSAWSSDSCATLSSLSEGAHLFEAWACDSLGNESHVDRRFTIDMTGPVVAITAGPADGGWSFPDVTFSWTGSDNLAPIDSLRYSYRLDDAPWSAYSSVKTQPYASLAAAEHTFRLRATDLAGNAGDSLTVRFTVDGIAPETEITTGPAENTIISPAQGPVLFGWTGNDDFTPADSLRFAYRLDAAAWTAFGTARSANIAVNIANGAHTFAVKARDFALNEDATPAQRTFIVDGSAPTIAFTSGPAAGQYVAAADISLCWVATDNQSPLDSIDYAVKLDAGAFGPWTEDSCASFMSLAEGSHTVTVQARDDAGNIGTATRSFFVDLTPPVATIVSGPAQGSFAGATVTYTWSGTDNLTAAAGIQFSYRMDENPWSAFSTAKTATFGSLSDGSHTFKLRARDLAANIGDSLVATFEVDLVPPDTWLVSGPAPGAVVDTTIARFSWAGSDDATPAPSIRYSYKIDAAAYSAFSTDTSATFANLADGSHAFIVKSRDLSLNEDPTPASRSFIVDARGPAITFIVAPAAGSHIAVVEVDFAWSGADVISPPESLTYSYQIDGQPYSAWSASTVATISGLAQGTHTFSVKGKDPLGNIGTASRSFTVDLTPPSVQVTSGPANGACWPQTTATFGWAGADNFSTSSDLRYAHAMDAEAYSAWSTGVSKTYTGLSSGAHVFHVKARDKAGNEPAYPTDVDFTVGNNDLVVTDVGIADSAYCNRLTTISWTVLNQGSCPVSGAYVDRVSISSDSLVGSDTQIGSFSRSGALDAGQSYTVTQDILLPDNISGNYWIVIAADAGSAIPEEGFEGNNSRLSSRILVRIPAHPDLRVAGIVAPAEGYANRGVYIDWTVENRGTEIARGRWTEYVYLSSDPDPGSDTKLSEFNYDYSLGVGESYTHTHPITYPPDISGDFWIIISADAKNNVSEYESESNNSGVSAQPVHIIPTPYPNLVVTSVQIPPDSASSNDEIEISWVVTNSGSEATNAPVWYDKVYLSPTAQLGGTYTVLGEFENLSYLSPGQSYNQQNRKVKIPKQTANGTYYIIVATDSRNNVYEHNDEGDNSRPSNAMPVRYVPYPRPNLAVSNFMASLTGWAGNQIRISYRVSNIGNESATGFTLTDWLWMAADSIIDPHTALHIGGDIAGEALAPAASYDRVVDITLPNNISGKRFLYVWTDVNLYYDDPNLDNNFSTISPIEIRIPPTPDLVVSNLSTANPTAQAGTALRVEWTVTNAGAGPGYVAVWRDAIYLSADDTLNTATDTRLAKVYRSGSLEPEASYTRSYDVTIPGGIEGTRYIFAQTDVDSEVPEGDYEGNNASGYAVPITVTPPPIVQLPESDLRVTSVWTEGEAWSGTAVPVSWTAKNMGPDDITVSSWDDRVYLSTDSVFSTSGDQLLVTLSHAGPLPVNATYSVTRNAAIPNGASGAYYLFVQTDATGKVNEPNHENDNVTRIALAVNLTPPPDLIVSELIASSDTLIAGQSGAVQWITRNDGTGRTVASTWSDKLYLSTDNVLSTSTDKYLQTFAHTGALEAGQFYQQNRSVTIPTGYVGSFYIIAATDGDGAVYEYTAEGNNTRAALVNLAAPPQIPPPNLVADTLQFVDGLKDTVRYAVRNAGVSSVPAAQRSWTDRVYLSTDATLNKSTDPILLTFNRIGDLAPGATYEVVREVTLPSGTSGTVYLFAVADVTEKVTEASETDNVISRTQAIALSYADLQVASATCPTTAPTGQPVQVAWSIGNAGNGLPVPETWYNGVYLSRDRILDETDYSLGSKYHQGGLPVGASRADSLTVTIPSGLSGTYYFFVKTDRNNTVYEYDREDNNIGYAQSGISIFIPPPDADLVVSDVTPPAGTVSGDTISIAWTVTNESEIPLTAQWRDAVYVSPDTIWDLSDSYLGEVPHTSGLGAGARYVQTLDVAAVDYFGIIDAIVPGLVPGSYHIVVRADIRNNVVESNEANNEGYSIAGMPVDVRALAMGSTETSQVGARERRYFKLQAPPGTDIRFYLSCFGVYDELEMYVRFGTVPDRITYDHYERISAAEQVIVPGSESEYCYIMIYGDYVPGSGDFSIRPEAFLFAVSKVDPTTVDNAGITTLSIIGGQLNETVSVALMNEEGASIEALDFSVPNSTNIEARFDLRGSAFGVYDVTVATTSSDTAVLASAVTIVPGQGAVVMPEIYGPDAIRQSITSDYVIALQNVGTADAYDVVSALILSSGTTYRLILDNVTTPYQVCLGETVLVHTNRIGVGKSAQYSVRIQGLSSLGVEIISINGAPILASTPTGTAIVSTLATGCAEAFADQLQEDGTSIDRETFYEAFASAWASAWGIVLAPPLRGETGAPAERAETGTGAEDDGVSSSLDDKITQSTLSALETLGDPLVPPYLAGVTVAGLDASLAEADVYVMDALQASNYKRKLKDVTVRVAKDPNEKYGPAEAGGDAEVSQLESVPYTIYFENMPDASAAARTVAVSDFLDAAFDWRRFRLGEIAFGNTVINVPPNKSYYHTTVNLDSLGMLLEIDAGINSVTGEAAWTFTTIDPSTGLPPVDPNAGFLPPNDERGRGQGHVFFTIIADPDIPDGTAIENRARIVFDLNSAIETNESEIFVHRVYPDLEISSAAGQSAYPTFIEGEPVTIEATVANRSDASASSFSVAFFDGDPDNGGIMIDSPRLIPGIAGNAEVSIDASWTPLRNLDQHPIYMRADFYDGIVESDETNNDRILVLGAQPKSYTASFAAGLNTVSLPLEPLEPHTARSFADLLGATQIIRYDTTGTGGFESFVVEQIGNGFPILPNEGYIATLPGPCSVTFSGITNRDTASVEAGLNFVSLPLDLGSPCTARQYCDLFGGTMVIRYNRATSDFEAFIPDFHSGGGFDVNAARAYFLAADTHRTVTLAGTGWMGVESSPPIGMPPAAKSDDAGDVTSVLGVTGTIYQEQWGQRQILMPGCTAIARNLATNTQIRLAIDDATGQFTGAFIAFPGAARIRANDRLQIVVTKPDGQPAGGAAEYVVTAEDIARTYIRTELTVSAATPAVTRLYQNFPNPFNPVTSIRYQLSNPGHVKLRVYSVTGELIGTLVNEAQPAGYFQVSWNGRNNEGRLIASGVYFYRLETPDYTKSFKMVILR